jgi:hypothetical protein
MEKVLQWFLCTCYKEIAPMLHMDCCGVGRIVFIYLQTMTWFLDFTPNKWGFATHRMFLLHGHSRNVIEVFTTHCKCSQSYT